MDNITGLSCFLFLLYNSLIFINLAGQGYHPINSSACIFKAIIVRSISCLVAFEIWIRHILKKLVFYNIKPCFLHSFQPHYGKKSPTLRRRTILSTQPLIYRILVSGKLSTRPFIYHISVSGKLSLYLHSNKHKEKSQ